MTPVVLVRNARLTGSRIERFREVSEGLLGLAPAHVVLDKLSAADFC